MTPQRDQIEYSFKLIKHGVWVNAHAKFGSDPPRNLREKLHQLWNTLKHTHTHGRRKPSFRVAYLATKKTFRDSLLDKLFLRETKVIFYVFYSIYFDGISC